MELVIIITLMAISTVPGYVPTAGSKLFIYKPEYSTCNNTEEIPTRSLTYNLMEMYQ